MSNGIEETSVWTSTHFGSWMGYWLSWLG